MELPKLTQRQWIGAGSLALVAIVLSFFLTNWWEGEAIEISVENAAAGTVFAYIDNTGRHGRNTLVEKLATPNGKETPTGLLLQPNQTRSFGTAVGLGDSPTLHFLPVTEDSRADTSRVNDCVFDTISPEKLRIPSRHIKVKWTGNGCETLY
ncbi:hypothetical protein [Mesorhizobium sp. M0058]|uniref:hypothetical protein n=1 Tax=Mesorhizobium sp. M0058 TaxID=2956865 RepID=UPI00333BCE7B